MSKDIRLKKVDNIVNDGYISEINNIVEDIRDITLEVKVEKYKIFELKNVILTILHLEDKNGKICALLAGSRDDEDFKKIINCIGINCYYRIRGSISFFNKEMYEDLDNMLGNDINIKDYLIGDKLLIITGIQNISKYYREYERTELFGVDITTVYDFELEVAYDFINKNTNYLKDISIDEVKEIEFSCYKDIVILLKNGKLLINGEEKLNNIKTLGFSGGAYIYSFSNDNVITCLIGNDKNTEFINNKNYKYKKIIINHNGIITLTYENTIRYFGMIIDNIIDYTKFYDVEDIGYIEEDDDIVVIKKDKTVSLFNNEDYSNNNNILLNGSGEDYIIINNNN